MTSQSIAYSFHFQQIIGFWTLKGKCTHYGICGEVAFQERKGNDIFEVGWGKQKLLAGSIKSGFICWGCPCPHLPPMKGLYGGGHYPPLSVAISQNKCFDVVIHKLSTSEQLELDSLCLSIRLQKFRIQHDTMTWEFVSFFYSITHLVLVDKEAYQYVLPLLLKHVWSHKKGPELDHIYLGLDPGEVTL